MTWLWLALASAFCLATADAFVKAYLTHLDTLYLMAMRFLHAGVLLLPVLLWWGWPGFPPAFWGWVAAMVPLELAAMYCYMRAVRSGDLSETLPYLAFTPVLVAGTGWALLGERVSTLGFGGALLVTVGAYWLNGHERHADGSARWWVPLAAMARNPGARWMLGTAVLYAFTSVLGKGALEYAPPVFFGAFYYLLLAAVVALGVLATSPRRRALLRVRPGVQLLVGVAMAGMVLCHFMAIAGVEVAYMITAKRTSLLFGMLYGALWFREARLGRNLGAGALMLAGVFLVAGS